MIRYTLVENTITSETKSYYAIVSSSGTKQLEDIITHMIEEGSGFTRPQAIAFFERLTQSVIHYANQGYSITTPLFRVRPTISGTFNSKEDKFDPKRHEIKIRSTEGLRLRKAPVGITKVVKISDSRQSPILYTFTDICSETKNKTITVGGIGILKGKQLRINPKDNRLGLFFVPINNLENKIRVKIYSYNKPSEIHFQIPELAVGTYDLLIQTISRNGKEILTGKLKTSLQVS